MNDPIERINSFFSTSLLGFSNFFGWMMLVIITVIGIGFLLYPLLFPPKHKGKNVNIAQTYGRALFQHFIIVFLISLLCGISIQIISEPTEPQPELTTRSNSSNRTFEDSFVGISGLGSLVYACCRTSAAAKERSHAQLNHSPMPFQTCSGGPSTSRMLKDRIAYNTPKDG